MPVAEYFSPDYASARELFCRTANGAGATLESYPLEAHHLGPKHEQLSIDVARLGRQDADRALIILSGTHGVEGFCGSGCQVGLLVDRLYEALPASGCALLIHALNPYGFAWLRRVNEQGVDLNRNFIDHSLPAPSSADYEELHSFLVPADWNGPARREADSALAGYIEKRGARAFQSAISGGQYTRPSGLFYGGDKLSWSAQTLKTILARHRLHEVRRAAVIDLHTGLGPYGYGEPIVIPSNHAELERARSWYGQDVKDLLADEAVSARLIGSVPQGVAEALEGVELTFVSLEFGTRPLPEVLLALRADHWLHSAGNANPALGDSIRRQMRDAFYCENPAWQTAVYGRTSDFVLRACRGLSPH